MFVWFQFAGGFTFYNQSDWGYILAYQIALITKLCLQGYFGAKRLQLFTRQIKFFRFPADTRIVINQSISRIIACVYDGGCLKADLLTVIIPKLVLIYQSGTKGSASY